MVHANFQYLFYIFGGVAVFFEGKLLRGTLRDNRSPSVTAIRPQINDMIRRFYHVKIVFYHYYCIAAV